MKLPVQVSAEARRDLVAAGEWCLEREPDSLLPLELFDEFDQMLGLIAEHPDAFPVYEGEIRRAILRQFPYGIYYVIDSECISVLFFVAMVQEQGPDSR